MLTTRRSLLFVALVGDHKADQRVGLEPRLGFASHHELHELVCGLLVEHVPVVSVLFPISRLGVMSELCN